MATVRSGSNKIIHSDGGIEFWVSRDGVVGSFVLPPQPGATNEEIEDQIATVLTSENDATIRGVIRELWDGA